MNGLMDRLSFWGGELTAAWEERTTNFVVPPVDQVTDRLGELFTSARQSLQAAPWLRGRGPQA